MHFLIVAALTLAALSLGVFAVLVLAVIVLGLWDEFWPSTLAQPWLPVDPSTIRKEKGDRQ